MGILPFNRLKVVPISDVSEDFHAVYLIYRKNAFQPRSVENFIQFVRDFNEGMPMAQRLHMNSLGDSYPMNTSRVIRTDSAFGDELIGAPPGLAGRSGISGQGGM